MVSFLFLKGFVGIIWGFVRMNAYNSGTIWARDMKFGGNTLLKWKLIIVNLDIKLSAGKLKNYQIAGLILKFLHQYHSIYYTQVSQEQQKPFDFLEELSDLTDLTQHPKAALNRLAIKLRLNLDSLQTYL